MFYSPFAIAAGWAPKSGTSLSVSFFKITYSSSGHRVHYPACVNTTDVSSTIDSTSYVHYVYAAASNPSPYQIIMGFNYMPSNKTMWFPSVYFDGSSISYKIIASNGKTYNNSFSIGNQY